MLYLAYGSNMLRKRIEDRVGPVNDLGKTSLPGYKIVFNKAGSNGSGKANLSADSSSSIWGVLYELSSEQMEVLDKEEKKYDRVPVRGTFKGADEEFMIYLAQSDVTQEGLSPTKKYLDYIVDGAIEHDFPDDYVQMLRNKPLFQEAK